MGISFDRDNLSVVEQERWIESVTADMIQITIIIIPAMLLHLFTGSRKPPFQLTDLGSYVTSLFKHLGEIIITFT